MAQPEETRVGATPLRSDCPINASVELFGDKWSLVVLRDIIFSDRRTFRALHGESDEGIASNVLSSRLKALVDAGLLTKSPVPGHRQKIDYRLTEAAIQLVPVIALLGGWGARWLEGVSPDIAQESLAFAAGGADTWEPFMAKLRRSHLSM